MTGVYRISNILDCQEYIGSTTRGLSNRWREHCGLLRRNKHPNWFLQSAWNAYGKLFFTFDILEKCSAEQCVEREQWWIDYAKPGYNICKVAYGSPMAGRILSPEHRAKIGAAHKGRTFSEERCRNMSLARIGRPPTEKQLKHIKEMVASNIGRPLRGNQITNFKRLAEKRMGIPRTEEVRQKISEAHKGKVLSFDHKMHISEGLKYGRR